MRIPKDNQPFHSRREILKATGGIAAVGALASVAIPTVHAAEDETIQIALVGCGGRGSGAARDALNTDAGPVKLVAMADVFQENLTNVHRSIAGDRRIGNKVDVPEDRRFIGFDGYRKAMDCLKPGDVVILATPPAFRWVHFTYAIEKGLNVFMEKPVAVDVPTGHKMFALGEEAKKKNLKVGVGLMCRHCDARGELFNHIRDGEIGDLLLLRAYRMAGPTGSAFVDPNTSPKRADFKSELLYQIKKFHGFLWASGGAYSDFLIHNIDECCWMKDAWPVSAKASGGRHYKVTESGAGDYLDQNFDSYSVEYTFDDGAKLMLEGRTMPGCYNEFASYAHGSKGCAVISQSGHFPSRARTYLGQRMEGEPHWQWAPKREPSPYQLEWDHLMNAIRKNVDYNEVKRGVEASLVAVMGRLAAHTGQEVEYKELLKHTDEFAPGVADLTMESAAPLQLDASGKYPGPMPGLIGLHEYLI